MSESDALIRYARALLGELPQDWQAVRLGDLENQGVIEDIQDGNHGERHPKASDYVPAGIPFVMAKDLINDHLDLKNCSFITREQAETLRIGFAKPGDVLLTHKATMGRVAIVPAGYDFIMLTPQVTYHRIGKPDALSNVFLKYVFLSPVFQHQLNSDSDQSTRKYIGISAQRNLWIPLPPLREQRAIASVLESLDNKIELNRQMNETLESMARSFFQSFLRQNTTSDVSKGWPLTKLSEVLSTIETGSRPKGGVGEITEGVPSVGAESIVGIGYFDYAKTKFVPREFFEAMNKGHVRNGDVLLYKDGGRPGEFEPHVTMVGDGFPFPEFCINEHVYRLRTDPILPQSFLYFWLSSDSTMDEMRNRGTGVAIPGLNSTQVREVGILRPPSELLVKFDRIVSPLLRRIFSNCNESRTLTALREALIPKLLSGKIRVSDNRPYREEFLNA